jgi:hypothetical protein
MRDFPRLIRSRSLLGAGPEPSGLSFLHPAAPALLNRTANDAPDKKFSRLWPCFISMGTTQPAHDWRANDDFFRIVFQTTFASSTKKTNSHDMRMNTQ